ncbi:MAG TPA: anthranilate phosphoribosyltransferase [Granulicella sp.]|jgi:anthranilate phosphoribosyltransferase|nr:anthranilate phosphoribosyltransferase [Granulicella sp.]
MATSIELRPLLRQLLEQRAPLTRDQARSLLNLILTGHATDIELAALLGALTARGETPEEIAGFVDAMRAAATPLPLSDAERGILTDTCGTGGDSSGTFNISTAAALVAAAAGANRAGAAGENRAIMVAKHGNRAVTSTSGSADVLDALGVPVDLAPEAAAAALRAHRFVYLHAPTLHPAMKAVMPVRRALGVRTVFNLLGPLTNPAGARAQVMGVYAADRVSLVAQAMLLLDTRHAFVVHGSAGGQDETGGGLDEISISGPTQIARVRDGHISLETVTPEQFGIRRAPLSALRGGDAATNAAILRAIFAGEPGPCRDIVLLNAAAVLVVADCAKDLHAGIDLARQAIDSGAVTALLRDLAAPVDQQP